MLRYVRAARSLRAWVPDHFRLCAAQVLNLERNRRLGLSDDDHLSAAVAWLERAQDRTGDGGISGAYDLRRGWTPSHPETTGTLIPTLLNLAGARNDHTLIDRAQQCARFLIAAQLDSGGFPATEAPHDRHPSVFHTAQILHGLLAWHRHAADDQALASAIRAADWMVSVQDADGAFRRYFHSGAPATYSSYASCRLAELGEHIGSQPYRRAAERHLEWVLRHFDESTSWFDLCGYDTGEHTNRLAGTDAIAHTIAGVLYLSQALGRADGIRTARLAALRALRRAELRGSIPGAMNAKWQPAAAYTCLAGNAQLALVWFHLFAQDNDIRYVNAALKALEEVKRAQPMHLKHPGLRGGIPGSAPVWGDYRRGALPASSARFFVDALLAKKEILNRFAGRRRPSGTIEPDRRILAPEPSLPALPETPGVVFYTEASSVKPYQVLSGTDHWGFAPVAMIVEKAAPVPLLRRVQDKLRAEGAATVLRSAFNRARRAVSSEAPGSAGQAAAVTPEQLCRQRGIPVWVVQSVNSPEALQVISSLGADMAISLGSGILRKSVLGIPKFGTLNAHMGLLPFYRGMNVAEWAALNMDRVGCTVHYVDPGVDTGAIVATRSVDSRAAAGIAELRALVDRAQVELLCEVLEWIFRNRRMPAGRAQRQEEGVQFFRMADDLRCVLERALQASHAGPTAAAEAFSPGDAKSA